MTYHNTFFFLQNFLQDFFNCQIIRGYFISELIHQLLPLSPGSYPVKSSFTIIIWWAYLDLNQGPRPYQGRALSVPSR